MQKKEIERFLTLRSKLWDEHHALEEQIGQVEEELTILIRRYDELTSILDGSVGGVEDLPEELVVVAQKGTDNTVTVDLKEQLDHAVLKFLIENPESSMKTIVDNMSEFAPDVPYKVSNAIKRLKRRELVVRTGTTRNAVWSA